MILSPDQLRALAASVGFPDPALMAAIAMAESGDARGGNTNAVNDTRNLTDDQIRAKFGLAPGTPVRQEWSIGLWQINAWSCSSSGCTVASDVDPSRLTDPVYNAQRAYARSAGGTNLNPWWLTVSRGAYKKYLPYVSPGPHPIPFPGVKPPRRDSGSAATIALTALALSATAGAVAYMGRKYMHQSSPVIVPPEYAPPWTP